MFNVERDKSSRGFIGSNKTQIWGEYSPSFPLSFILITNERKQTKMETQTKQTNSDGETLNHSPKTTKTIGEKAHDKAMEYFQAYKDLKQFHPKLNAESLSQHDLIVEKLVSEFALEELKKLIAEEKLSDERLLGIKAKKGTFKEAFDNSPESVKEEIRNAHKRLKGDLK